MLAEDIGDYRLTTYPAARTRAFPRDRSLDASLSLSLHDYALRAATRIRASRWW